MAAAAGASKAAASAWACASQASFAGVLGRLIASLGRSNSNKPAAMTRIAFTTATTPPTATLLRRRCGH